MRNKAVVLDEQRRPPTVEEVEVLPPRAGEVMVRLAATGVTTDGFISVSAGAYHTCGVWTNGTVDCWGSDEYGRATAPGAQ